MRSQASSNELRTILIDNFRKYWIEPALGIAFFLLWGFIPFLLSRSGSEPEDLMRSLEQMSYNENFGYLTAILILGVGTGMAVFSYLQNPASAGYMHSLPVKRDRLFAANVLSGLLMIAAPIVVNGLIMTILAGNALFLKWMVFTGIICFAIFAVTVLAGMLSGNILMHLFNTAFLNGFVSIFILMIVTTCSYLLIGYAYPENWTRMMFDTNLLSGSVGVHDRLMLSVVYLAVAVLALVLARFLYRKRRIERTGDSVMFPWVRTILFLYCMFCGSTLSGILLADLLPNASQGFGISMIIGTVLGGLLIFLVGSVLIDRSAKIFTRRNLMPAVIALVMSLVMTFCLSNDVLGFGTKVPDTDQIKTVYLYPNTSSLFTTNAEFYDINNQYGWASRFDGAYYNVAEEDTAMLNGITVIGLHSTAAIDAARQLQEQLIEQQEANRTAEETDVSYSSEPVDLIYERTGGSRMHRQYVARQTDEVQTDGYDYSKEILRAVAAYYDSAEFKKAYSLNNLKDDLFTSGTITYYPMTETEEEYYSEEYKRYAIPHKYAAELKAALEADFQECSFEDSRICTSCFTVRQGGSSWQEIAFPVSDAWTHTHAWLEEHKDLLK